MKLLIIGNARHGKDTVAEYIQSMTGLSFQSSSMAAAEHIIFPELADKYKTLKECFDDRVNHRNLWYDMICKFNKDDPSRLARNILHCHDICVGMRSDVEVLHSRCLFDLVIWVDAGMRVPAEPKSSCTVTADHADVVILNNGTLQDLKHEVQQLFWGQLGAALINGKM